ncbi:MAG: AI-2E family transporter [Acutalibacteraceae bacterium]|nr:AI-2E family transporter [Acutalibacteraceae bacterium]
MSKKKFKQIMLLILFAVAVLFIVNNVSVIWKWLGTFVTVAMPFIIGFCIAYIINKPYVFFSDKMLAKMDNSKVGFIKNMKKPLSMILAYVLVLGIVTFLIGIIIPQLVESFDTLVKNFSGYAESFKEWIVSVAKEYFNMEIKDDNDLFNMVNDLVAMITGGEILEYVTDFASNFANKLPTLFNTAVKFTSTLYNVIIGIIISVYFLSCKEKLIYQCKKFTVAYFPEKALPKTFEVAELTDKIFGKYVYGRIIGSMIIAMICFIGMSILRFDYPLLISVVIGITNIIPVFGPFIGIIPSILILLFINPIEAVWFTVFIVVLQQVDANLIEPKVMGSSIGISGFWVIASVTIGGGLFGVLGMFIAVPVFSVFYILISRSVNDKLKEKNYLQQLADFPEDIANDDEKQKTGIKDLKLYKTIKENVTEKVSSINKQNKK